jgi:hypothetical protein
MIIFRSLLFLRTEQINTSNMITTEQMKEMVKREQALRRHL